jgi:hypothetical protein
VTALATGSVPAASNRWRVYFETGHFGGDLLADRRTGIGRVCEITNGGFVEAKQENRWLAVRPLWSNPAGRYGSATSVDSRGLQPFDQSMLPAGAQNSLNDRIGDFAAANGPRGMSAVL